MPGLPPSKEFALYVVDKRTGRAAEIRVEEIVERGSREYHGMVRVEIEGHIMEDALVGARPMEHVLAGIAEDAGGLPSLVFLTCPTCKHRDEGHDCGTDPAVKHTEQCPSCGGYDGDHTIDCPENPF